MAVRFNPTPRTAEIITAIRDGEPRVSIAARFGMTVAGIDSAMARWQHWTPVIPKTTTPRRCLSCRELFQSDGVGNRLCGDCKDCEVFHGYAAVQA